MHAGVPHYRSNIFISSTSSDLLSYRKLAAAELLTAGYYPIVQEYFAPDHRSLGEVLEASIADSDAVLCLVGFAFGVAPERQEGGRRSYTQIEYDTAKKLGKPIYIIAAASEDVCDDTPVNAPEDATLQMEYRRRIEQDGKVEYFRSHEELRAHILRIIPKLPNASFPARWAHRPKEPAFFVGRKYELQQLSDAGKIPVPCVIAVIGIGGQGKSTLVARWVRQLEVAAEAPFKAIYWCTAQHGGFTFEEFVDDVLQYLLSGAYEKRRFADDYERVRQVLSIMAERRVLIILDGVEKWFWGLAAEDGPASAHHDRMARLGTLDEFLSQATAIRSGSHLVLTSRAMPAVLDDANVRVVPLAERGRAGELEGLDPEACVTLFRECGVAGTDAELIDVAESYAYHPLAVTVIAGSLAKRYGGQVGSLPRVRALDTRERLFALLDNTDRELVPSQRSVLQVAAHTLENPGLAQLASVLHALHAPNGERGTMDSVPVRGQEVWSEEEILDLILALDGWKVLQWHATACEVVLHPIVKDYYVRNTPDGDAIHRQLASWYGNQASPSHPVTLADARTYFLAIEHSVLAGDIKRCLDLVYGRFTATATFLEWLSAMGHLETGTELLERLGQRCDADQVPHVRNSRAVLLRQAGRLDEAKRDLDQVVEWFSAAAAAHDSSVAEALVAANVNRGNVFRELSLYESALGDFAAATERLSRDTGDAKQTNYLRVRVLANWADVYYDMGHLNRALAMYNEAISNYSRSVDRHLLDVDSRFAGYLRNRGNIHFARRAFGPAIEDYTRALDIYALLQRLAADEGIEKVVGTRHLLANAFRETGRTAEAVSMLNTGIAEIRDLIDAGRDDLEFMFAMQLGSRAFAQAQRGAHDAALADNTRAIRIFRRLIEQGRPYLRGQLARALLSQAQFCLESSHQTESDSNWLEGRALAFQLMDEHQVDLGATYAQFVGLRAFETIRSGRADPEPAIREMVAEYRALMDRPALRTDALRVEVEQAIERLNGGKARPLGAAAQQHLRDLRNYLTGNPIWA